MKNLEWLLTKDRIFHYAYPSYPVSPVVYEYLKVRQKLSSSLEVKEMSSLAKSVFRGRDNGEATEDYDALKAEFDALQEGFRAALYGNTITEDHNTALTSLLHRNTNLKHLKDVSQIDDVVVGVVACAELAKVAYNDEKYHPKSMRPQTATDKLKDEISRCKVRTWL